ncbi:MAG: hypothetical protein WC378_02120, partial [Opitutaceae bacterium]
MSIIRLRFLDENALLFPLCILSKSFVFLFLVLMIILRAADNVAPVSCSAGNIADAIPSDRRTRWQPGIHGGIPNRTTIYATIDAAKYTGWVRVAGLLHDVGLSGLPDRKLAIKVEIDTRPPTGALCERRVVTRHVTFLLQHYDLPSLLAGK